jgi:uroporphyrinogen decarboxylase
MLPADFGRRGNTMTTSMTSQERVNAMMERRDHDRVPRHDTFWAETVARWKDEGLIGNGATVLELLGSDFRGLQWLWPQAFPGQSVTISEDAETRTFRDGHGKTVRYWKNKAGTPEHVGFDCDSRERWETIYKPALCSTGLQIDPAAVVRAYRQGREQSKWCHLTGVEVFEQTRALMGDEITAMALIEDPEWVMDVAETFIDQLLMNFDALMATGIQPDGLWIYGDMAYNRATFCSPAMYKEMLWPQHKRLVEWAHAHRMKFIYHTDGNVNQVMDLWVEAGFDCFQPIEAKADMDVRDLAPKYGDKLSFFGNIDVMVMGTNDLDKIEEEIKTKFAAGMANKGYAYHSDHSVPPQVSWDTYQHIIRLVEKYGNYE